MNGLVLNLCKEQTRRYTLM